jgi:hypothetical protein
MHLQGLWSLNGLMERSESVRGSLKLQSRRLWSGVLRLQEGCACAWRRNGPWPRAYRTGTTRGGCKARRAVQWRKAKLTWCVSPPSSYSRIMESNDTGLLFLKIFRWVFKMSISNETSGVLRLLIFLYISTHGNKIRFITSRFRLLLWFLSRDLSIWEITFLTSSHRGQHKHGAAWVSNNQFPVNGLLWYRYWLILLQSPNALVSLST